MIQHINKAWHGWRVEKITREVELQKRKANLCQELAMRKDSIVDEYDIREAQYRVYELESALKHHQDQLKLCSPE